MVTTREATAATEAIKIPKVLAAYGGAGSFCWLRWDFTDAGTDVLHAADFSRLLSAL